MKLRDSHVSCFTGTFDRVNNRICVQIQKCCRQMGCWSSRRWCVSWSRRGHVSGQAATTSSPSMTATGLWLSRNPNDLPAGSQLYRARSTVEAGRCRRHTRLTEEVILGVAVTASNLGVFLKWFLTSEVYEPVLPRRQHHGQSHPLHVGQSSQLWVCHGRSLSVREHADLPVVEHYLQGTFRAAQTRQ